MLKSARHGNLAVLAGIMCLAAASLLFAVQSPNGFAVWANGSGWDRTLYMIDLTENTQPNPGTAKKVCDKGPVGGDIMPAISFDGKWVAFSRDKEGAPDGYGPNDYHNEWAFEICLVRVDGQLPNNNVIKIGDQGAWASWARTGGGAPKAVDGDFGPPYTLYYSNWNQGIKKVTVSEDGQVSGMQVYNALKTRFMMCAPNGNYAAYYPGHIAIKNLQTGQDVQGNSFSCHPSFCSDSYWVLYGRQWASNIVGDKVYTGIGDYHYGSSNDMEWAISRRTQSGNDQNTAHEIGVWKMNAQAHNITFELQFDVGMGNFPDIHVFTGPSLSVSAASSVIDMNGSVELTATANNFDGAVPTINWTVSGGSVSPTTGNIVTFTPGSAGDFTITATAGDVSGSAAVSAKDYDNLHLKINLGGGAVGDWEASGYASGGSSYDFEQKPSTGGVECAAPADVYQTVYHSPGGDHSLDFDVPDGKYTVRMHFFDIYGDRTMEFLIEGSSVLSNFSPTAGTAVVEEFVVDVTGGLQVEAKSHGGDVFLAGIEILRGEKPCGSSTAFQGSPNDGMALAPIAAANTRGNAFVFSVGVPGAHHIDILDLSGTVVKSFTGNGASTHVWDAHVAAGIYAARMIVGNRSFSTRFLIGQ